MSTNCLVKKLKETVNDSSLAKIGEIKLATSKLETVVVNSQLKVGFAVPSGVEYTVRVDGNGYFADSASNLEISSARYTEISGTGTGSIKNYYFKNDDYNIFIGSKYEFLMFNIDNSGTRRLHLVNLDLRQLEYSDKLVSLMSNGTHNTTGDIKYLKRMTNLEQLSIAWGSFYGNIKEIGHLTKLKDGYIYIGGSSVEGNLEDFVAQQVASGVSSAEPFRASGLFNTNIKFHGYGKDEIYTPYGVSSQRGYLYWNTANKIIYYCASTYVGISTPYTDMDLIFECGATSEEITAWQAAGKTVTDVVNGVVYPPTN